MSMLFDKLAPRRSTLIVAASAALVGMSAALTLSVPGRAAEGCNPPCPKGQVCAFKDARGGKGAVVCKTPIKIDCPTNDPLCGADNKRKRSLKADR